MAYRQLSHLTGITPPLNLMEVILTHVNQGRMREKVTEVLEEYLIEVKGKEIIVQSTAVGTESSEVNLLHNGEIELKISK